MMTSLTKFALAVVAALLMTAGFAADDDTKAGGDSVDWITMENGRLRDAFVTADATLAQGFVATGINPQTIILTLSGAEYRAVLRGGQYWSSEGNPDTSKDKPASAEVLDDEGRRLFASKGYQYMEARTEQNAIIIRHWIGAMGCSLIDYHLQPIDNTLTITKTTTISTKDNKTICPPQ